MKIIIKREKDEREKDSKRERVRVAKEKHFLKNK